MQKSPVDFFIFESESKRTVCFIIRVPLQKKLMAFYAPVAFSIGGCLIEDKYPISTNKHYKQGFFLGYVLQSGQDSVFTYQSWIGPHLHYNIETIFYLVPLNILKVCKGF